MSRIYLFVLGILTLGIVFSVGSEAAPSTGTIQVAFILSEFEDQEYQDGHDQDYFEDLAFGETDSMWEYFDEVSRSELNIEGDVFGPYTLDGDAEDYGTENQNFVRDSVEIADDDIDYRDYDAIMVIHSGPGEESSGNSDDIWSIHWSTNIETEDNGYEIKKITQAPEYENSNGERNPLGVWCHEFGHELGLPDLYDYDNSSEGIGNWGLMGSGSWANNGETPVYLAAWSRYELEWIEPVVITDDITGLVLEPIEDGGITYMLPIPGNWSGSDEYFLIENRQQMKYDQYMSGEGLLIWHIDDSQGGNSDEDHKLVDLEEADGNDDLDHATNRGDEGDPYNSGSFTKDSYPDSLAYNGTESGWKIENIEMDGSNIIVDISFLSKPHAVADADEAVIAEGFELQFYGDGSWDEDGNIVNYTWDFGDGTFSYDENPIHIFTTNGTYDVILTVRDNNNLEDSVILNIFVNKPPIAVVEISQTVILLGDVITFDASDSYDIDGEVEFFYWNFDDGFTSNQATIEHEFRNSGFYNVSVKIIDDLNDITTVYYLIEVINRLPIVEFSIEPESGDTRTIFGFIDQSYDNDGEVEAWLWDFGDSDSTDSQNTEHRFTLPGIYTVTLTVYDDQEGFNSTNKTITVENSPPDPDIIIPEGIKTGDNQWTIPADRTIIIDGRVSTDTENDELLFYWEYEGDSFQGYLFEIDLQTGIHEIQLNVIDERGGEETETFTLNAESVPILSLQYSEVNILTSQPITLNCTTDWGEIEIYTWQFYDDIGSDWGLNTTDDWMNFSSERAGEYFVSVSGKHTETGLWTIVFPLNINVYDHPEAQFEFTDTINEGDWITFDGKNSNGLELEFEWILDGTPLAGNGELITTLVDYGGIHTVGLQVSQNPVGEDYIEKEFYADHKPTEILSTNPSMPRVGEDFEVYLGAYDVEGEATIEYIEISVYDIEGDERGKFRYEDQGANFNIIFEVEYTGVIVLEYKLMDLKNNSREGSSTVDVLGWADIYVESLEISGKKEKGKTQTVTFVLNNYNETYQSDIYNGYIASGSVELLIDSEIVSTWTYEIEPTKKQEFHFQWKATSGRHDFEVVAYVSDGEKSTDNNNLIKSIKIESESKSGLIPYPSVGTIIATIGIVSYLSRRKAN